MGWGAPEGDLALLSNPLFLGEWGALPTLWSLLITCKSRSPQGKSGMHD